MNSGIISAKEIKSDQHLTCEVLVIGSGSGGGAAAARLAEGGMDTLLLEEGSYYDQSDFTRKLTEMTPKIYRDAGFSLIYGNPCIVFQEGKCIGGSTVMNGGMAWHTPERIMKVWREEHGIAFMTPETMRPYFEYIDQSLHVAQQSEDSISHGEKVFKRSAESLGYEVTKNFRSQNNCRGSNVCILGCPDNRKQTVQNTYIPRALQAGARIYTESKVQKILADNRRVKGVSGIIKNRESGKKFKLRVDAKIICVAAGALQTPALLQRSKLANGNGRVGKNFLCHPNVKAVGLYDEPMNQWKGVHQAHQIHHFIEEGFIMSPGGVPPAAIAPGFPQFGSEHLNLMEQYDRMLSTAVMLDDTTSGWVKALPFDIVWPYYQIDSVMLDRIYKSMRLLAGIHLNAGARKVFLPFAHLPEVKNRDELAKIGPDYVKKGEIEIFTVHAMGTCAMGGDPKRHVVQLTGEAWEVPGLFINDASLLPTSIGVNPQVTIQALSTRIADHILENRKHYLDK